MLGWLIDPGATPSGEELLDAVMAAAGISMANCLLVVTLAPMVTVVGYELLGHRHAAEAIARNLADTGA